MRFGFLIVLSAVIGCTSAGEKYRFPTQFAKILPDSIGVMSPQASKEASLGRALFYDPILSRDSSVSCASCHFPQAAFGDHLIKSKGIHQIQPSARNTPPLFNLYWRTSFFYDGGVPRLEQVALAPMQNHKELDLPIEQLSLRLQANPQYIRKFNEVYGQLPDPYTITRALAWFQRSLISLSSPFDVWLAGDTSAISQVAQEGWALFQSARLNCKSCHPAPAFTDGNFYHLGLASEGIDTGRARISHDWDDFGKFRTPSLRNLSYSAPYMHDGTMATVAEVVAYLDKGGSNHPLQHPTIQPLRLSNREKEQLLAFLKALDDETFIRWPAYQYQPDDYQD